MTVRADLIEKLSDEMDPDNAAALVDAALAEHTDALRKALITVRAHTSYVNPTLELLQGLLASIERIVDAALAKKG